MTAVAENGGSVQSSGAPRLQVSQKSLTLIEHPYIIKNLDRGIRSLGGSSKLRNLVNENKTQAEARLYNRPGDRLSKPLYSHNEPTHNLILKITVPKDRGTKQTSSNGSKASSDIPRPEADSEPAANLLAKIHASRTECRFQVIGIAEQTHRFRTLPDFVTSSSDSPFMQKMKDTVLPFEYDRLKQFKFDMSKGVETNADIIPPPSWSHFQVPFNYAYRQNPAVVTALDHDGQAHTWNTQMRAKTRTQFLPADCEIIPDAPLSDVPPVSSLDPPLQNLIQVVNRIMEERPIVTRRSLPNLVPALAWQTVNPSHIKNLFQYLGYTFSSGPWKDALIKFGIDPRTNPKYRIYQTVTFIIETPPDPQRSTVSEPQGMGQDMPPLPANESHIFDGSRMKVDGKTWQVCDITDPVLKEILATPLLRQRCHLDSDGWFHNGTWAKAKSIMRWKIASIMTGDHTLTNVEYARVAAIMPDICSETERQNLAELTVDLNAKERELASMIRVLHRRGDDIEAAGEEGHKRSQARKEEAHERGHEDDDVEMVDESVDSPPPR